MGKEVKKGNMGLIDINLKLSGFSLEQIWLYINTRRYRKDYPVKDKDKEFYLVWVSYSNAGGILYLFDKKTKLYRHVTDEETAKALYFIPSVHNIKETLDQAMKNCLSIDIDNTKLEFAKYNNGLPIMIKKYIGRR